MSSPRLRTALALGAAFALVLGILVVAVSGDGSSQRERIDVRQDRLGPVLIVPGYGGVESGLIPLRDALRDSGRDARIVSLPDDGQGDLREQAKVLDRAVKDALEGGDAGSVDIVGYSAGGVVARIWLKDMGGDTIARRIVTIGTPHHGTRLASLASYLPKMCPTACVELAPDSDLLEQLNAGDETPNGPQYVSIWSDRDGVVLPADSANLDGAQNIEVQAVCADSKVDHGGLPQDAMVIGIVLIELGVPDVRTPDASECAALRNRQ